LKQNLAIFNSYEAIYFALSISSWKSSLSKPFAAHRQSPITSKRSERSDFTCWNRYCPFLGIPD